MIRVLNLAGKNSSEIFQLRYPYSLLSFCDFDLSYFAEKAIAICDEALRSGELDFDRVTELRNSLKSLHVYVEHNLRTIYDKIVLDCWIDYVCRRDNIGTSGLWNRFIDCKTPFEKAVFVRLCEYRYNKGINEWLNIVRVQDYARSKVFFLFSRELSGVDEAMARRNYFDLMFSVTASELGCRIEDLGVTQVYSAGRLPSAPLSYPNISKEIIKSMLPDFDYSDDYSDIGSYEVLSDQIAMDAFSHMKAGLTQEMGSYNISRPAMEHAPSRIFMPCGLKAAVDLEIDSLLESGGWLARCKRCGRYYVRDSEYNEDYCSLQSQGGKTCLELYEMEHPKSRITPEIEQHCKDITDEMYSRVTADTMSLKEYESWKKYLEAMKGKVQNGEIQAEDLEAFIEYSKSLDISRSNPVVEVRKKEPERRQERVVKPFVPERISRSDMERKPEKPAEEPEEIPRPQPRREGFFTSPSVERQKSQSRAPISHIIRGGEQRHDTAQPYRESYQEQPVYSQPAARTVSNDVYREPVLERPERQQQRPTFEPFGGGFQPYAQAQPEQRVQPAPKQPEPEVRREQPIYQRPEPALKPIRSEQPAERRSAPLFDPEDFRNFIEGRRKEAAREEVPAVQPAVPQDTYDDFEDEPAPEWENIPAQPQARQPEPAPQPEPKPRVIRKNAAAISAYGKIAGTPLAQSGESAPFEAVSRPEQLSEPEPSPVDTDFPTAREVPGEMSDDPFWEVSSIFDVLEQSESDMSKPVGHGYSEPEAEKAPEKPAPAPAEIPEMQDIPEKPKSGRPRKRAAAQKMDVLTPDVPTGQSEPEPLQEPAQRRHRSPARHAEPAAPVTNEETPSGIWTEERHLFPPDEPDSTAHDELNMLKDKKRGRSSKTQRLFDAIMKEPDDNPNFRKK